jgi:hypothetical protein
MTRVTSTLLLCALGLAGLVAAEPAPSPSLRKLLTPQEFERAGLTKLTPGELGALEAALAAHARPPTSSTRGAPSRSETAAESRRFGEEELHRAPATGAELRTRIEGTVTDLTGRSVFALENGQVWQQRIPDRILVPRPLLNPEVIITHGIGGYKMDITGLDRIVFVKRIQ